ncbi:hypothetical protein [Dactylosporangium matsuzakiense]|nr:hypothetical protein [Dactylosporangium matsuzakiense]
MMIVYHPDPGSADADALALLASADLPAGRASAAARHAEGARNR